MEELDVLRAPQGRVKHGGAAVAEFDFSHTVNDVVITYRDADDIAPDELQRAADRVTVSALVPFGTDVTAQDRITLPDGLIYRIVGKPIPRRNSLTGTQFKTLILLERIEG